MSIRSCPLTHSPPCCYVPPPHSLWRLQLLYRDGREGAWKGQSPYKGAKGALGKGQCPYKGVKGTLGRLVAQARAIQNPGALERTEALTASIVQGKGE